MKKILTVYHSLPENYGYTPILFRNVLEILRKKINVHVTWVIHNEEKIDTKKFENNETSFLHISDFKNAVQILEKVKPDLVYVIFGFNAPDHAILLAAKYLKIKVVGGEVGNFLFLKNPKNRLSMVLDKIQLILGNNFSFKKLRFFIYKHIFLLRTYFAVHLSMKTIFKEWVEILRIYTFPGIKYVNLQNLDLLFVESQKTIDDLLKYNINKIELKPVGNPSYDLAFQSLNKFKNIKNKSDQVNLLILSMTVIGDTQKTVKKQRELFIGEIIKKIKKSNQKYFITLKIHPTNENYSDYEKIVNKIDPTIKIHQKGDLLDFLQDADVIITPASGTAIVFSLIINKPIVIWNVFKIDDDILIKRKLVIECKNENHIIESIEKALVFQPSKSKVDMFLEEYYYKNDGKASERIANIMLDIME